MWQLNPGLITSRAAHSPSASVGPPTLTFVSSNQLTDAGANKTLTGASIGSAVSTRQLFIIIDGNGSLTAPTSITFTPNAGSPVVASVITEILSATNPYIGIYQANVGTGTTTDMTMAFASNPFRNFSYSLWYADGAQMNSTTRADVQTTTGTSVASLSVNLNAPAGGFILTGAAYEAVTNPTTTWTGGETFTKRSDQSSSGHKHSNADASNITGGASDTVTSSWSLSAADVSLAAAVWR